MRSITILPRRVRSLPLLALLLAGVACDRTPASDEMLIGTNTFLVDEQVTSEKYTKWVQAQENLNRNATDADMISAQDRLGIRRATRGAVDSAVNRLEQNERTRQAIESAGLSVREYVLLSLALSQAFVASNPDRPVVVEGIPAGNVEFVRQNRADLERFRRSSRFRVVDDRDTDSDGRKVKRNRDTDRDTDKRKGRRSDRDT